LLEIAGQCARKYFRDEHPEFEEIVQEVVLGVLERQHEFDPRLGPADRFAVSVARQKARNRMEERQHERDTVCRNHRARIPYKMKHRDAEEADQRGRLPSVDLSLAMKKLESILSPELLELLRMLKNQCSEPEIREKLGCSEEEYFRMEDELKAHVKSLF
jgi:RNA polymerase sigma factor (sigma-70 family)